MIVSLPTGGKGVGLFVHDVMGKLSLQDVVFALPKKALNLIIGSNCCQREQCVDCTLNNFQPQSGEEGIDVSPVNTTSDSQVQNVGFNDGEEEVISSIPHDLSYMKVDSSQNIDLGSFLTRPVQIYEQSWQIGTHLSAATSTFRPWNLFFDKTSIKKKLDNYYMVRCNLHLKFVINASPFYYGCCLVAYQPYAEYQPALILTNAARNENIPLSQRPHIYLYPQNNQGGEMVLPFINKKNWVNATSSAELDDMGIIDLQSFTVLRNANGLTTESINIKVYAWAEDLEVAGPTIKLAVQAGKDEYSHKGTVSKPASAIARSMGKLGKLPIIGPFATATSYAAGAVSDIASLFGYTDVPVIDDVHSFRPKPFPNLAATDIGTPIEKLTLDAKNELSIDGKISGGNVEDELLISSFCGRESFIFKTDWTVADVEDTSLFFCKVSPMLLDKEVLASETAIFSTPMNHVSQCFSYWRGDIKYKFKFICSPYHTGRVRINWDPIGDIGVTGDYTTETYTRIVDISKETEVEVCIPYTQPTSYLDTTQSDFVQFARSDTGSSGSGERYNGVLTLRVLNEQTSPVASADIGVLVYVSGCENLEFAGPRNISSLYSPYRVQSGEMQFDINEAEFQLGVKKSVADDSINLIYMGESVVSLRQLMRRSTKYKRIAYTLDVVGDSYVTSLWTLGRCPQYPGFDPNGDSDATGLKVAIPFPYNWVCWNAVTWFSQCFIGSRGSYHYAFNPSTNSNISLSTTRLKKTRVSGISTQTDDVTTQRWRYMRRFVDTSEQSSGMAGLTVINQKSLAGDMVSLPMYSKFKFMSNDPLKRTDGTPLDESDTDTMQIECLHTVAEDRGYIGVTSIIDIDSYVSAGTDFSLVFFLNVPTVYKYDSYPQA
jgi:hypothetical protein